MPWWNPFDWFNLNDNKDENESQEEGEEAYDAHGDASEMMKITDDPDFDGWDQKGQIPRTDPPRRTPDTGPLKRKWF